MIVSCCGEITSGSRRYYVILAGFFVSAVLLYLCFMTLTMSVSSYTINKHADQLKPLNVQARHQQLSSQSTMQQVNIGASPTSDFRIYQQVIQNGVTQVHIMNAQGLLLSYAQFIEGCKSNATFRDVVIELLQPTGYTDYLWEVIGTDQARWKQQPFECVLIKLPYRSALDYTPFLEHLKPAVADQKVVIAFPSLSGDSLVVPVPSDLNNPAFPKYGHLADFIKHAPLKAKHELLRLMAHEFEHVCQSSARPMYLSTNGLAVAWLHVRIEHTPKYYNHQPYKRN